jgi:glutamate/tyrosine decarboxylase-like PLP-dependent enzyme
VIEPDWKGPLGEAFDHAVAYLSDLAQRPVAASASTERLRATLGGPLPQGPSDPRQVVADLATAAAPGVVASGSGRYFGFVIGGSTPAAMAADWLTAAWDQNAGLQVAGPSASVVEEITAGWLAELLGLPDQVSVGFLTGAQMATFTGLVIGVREVLARHGWDVQSEGLFGAPRIRVFAGQGRHDTIDRALRFQGLGTGSVVPVGVDDQGRMRADLLAELMDGADGPVIVCAQAGNVNSGAFDPLTQICEIAHRHRAWVHVDGAFGLWAAASPALRHLTRGAELADSWATDAHKWLNVPYDSGLVFCAHPRAHQEAMGVRAGYLVHSTGADRDAIDYGPDFSRRARGFAVYAAIRALGRSGIAELVERCCGLATRFAARLEAGGADVVNDVVLNQVLVRFPAGPGSTPEQDDAHTRAVIARVQRDGTCWMSGTTWQDRAAMRISVSNWSTDEEDVDRSAAVVLHCAGTSAGRTGSTEED